MDVPVTPLAGAALPGGRGRDLRAVGLSLAYEHRVISEDLSVQIPDGRVTVIVGANACGKSTLLRGLARLLEPRAGGVLLDGEDIHRLPTKEVATRLGILPQQPVAPEGITVSDLVARGRHPHQRFFRQWSDGDEVAVEAALLATRTSDLADRCVDELSGGQRQRAWIALALAQDTPLMLLDEPTTFLDLAHQVEVLDLLADLNERGGRTIVLVLHDLNLACRYADHLIAMKDGSIVAEGPPEQVVTEETVAEVFGLHAQIVPDPITGTPLVIPVPSRLRRPPDPVAETIDRIDAAGHCSYSVGSPPADGRWLVLGQLLADPESIDGLVGALLAGDARGQRDVAGSYVASWLAGPPAHAVATAWRTEGRVLHLELDHVSVRFHVDGWVDGVAIGEAGLTVGAQDQLAGVAGVRVAVDAEARLAAVAGEIRALAEPIFAAVRARVPYGRAGMWGSLVDELAAGALLAEQRRPDGGDPERAWADIGALLDALAGLVPELRARPRRQLIPWSGGTRHQSVRGTCCLHYKTCADPDPSGDGYCSSCPHRPDGSRAERIAAWLEGTQD